MTLDASGITQVDQTTEVKVKRNDESEFHLNCKGNGRACTSVSSASAGIPTRFYRSVCALEAGKKLEVLVYHEGDDDYTSITLQKSTIRIPVDAYASKSARSMKCLWRH